jgi:hypothetical protein
MGRMRLLAALLLAGALAVVLLPDRAAASPYVRYGIQDDAWLAYGEGSLDQRLNEIDALGVDVVRYTLPWNAIAARMPRNGRNPDDRAYAWGIHERVLKGLHAHGIAAVVTLAGTPRWANGGRAPNYAPRKGAWFANFAYASSKRLPWVRDWLIWNEPNQRRWLIPTSPVTYTAVLLNPAYAALKQAGRGDLVGGGVTAPRGGTGGVSPVRWIQGMKRAHARLDAYAHHPYPTTPGQTPTSGGCGHCETITMATLERLISAVGNNFGRKRIWLTEYGYQTNPPDRFLGVSKALQAAYVGQAALRVWKAPYVDMLIHYLYRDEPVLGRWQSGLQDVRGARKPAHAAFRLPIAQVSRQGLRTVLWGMVRPRAGAQLFRLQQYRGGKWVFVGATRRTSARGAYTVAVRAGKGVRFRAWSPRDRAYSAALVVR